MIYDRRGTARGAPTDARHIPTDIARHIPTDIPRHIPTDIARRAPTTIEQFGKPVAGSIPTIVRAFKSAATLRINQVRQTPGAPVWQRNYWEHVIRDEASYQNIAAYILNNPAQWEADQLFQAE
jgi:hypothetical protein